jgi:hypothetical protein
LDVNFKESSMAFVHSRHSHLLVAIALLFVLGNKGCSEHRAQSGGGLRGAPKDAGTEAEPDAGERFDAAAPDATVPDAAAPDAQTPPEDDAGTAVVCGTRGAAACDDGEFCNFEPDSDCGDTDRGGRCQARPDTCTFEFNPVCGCDLRSYSNACAAHAVGSSVKHAGMCDSQECAAAGGRPVFSDGASTPACEAGELQWDIGGVDEPAICCLAQTQGKTCGGIAALPCETGEFCNYEQAAGGQGCNGMIADAAGVCEAQPAVCPDQFEPVCGCDRRSYANACAAHAAGASIMHDGQCTEVDCAAIGGHPVDGIGPGPMCPDGEDMYTFIGYSNGMMAIEGTACCVPR